MILQALHSHLIEKGHSARIEGDSIAIIGDTVFTWIYLENNQIVIEQSNPTPKTHNTSYNTINLQEPTAFRQLERILKIHYQ